MTSLPRRRRAARFGALALFAVAAFSCVATAPLDADARPRFGQIAKTLLKTGGKPSVDIRVAVQSGRRDCSKTLNQNADINFGFVVQRCANNRAIVNQGGLLNRGNINQR